MLIVSFLQPMRCTGVCLELTSLSKNVANFLGKRITKKMGFENLTFVILVFIFISPLTVKVTPLSIKGQNEIVATYVFFYIGKMLKYWMTLKSPYHDEQA